ncbi:hypothetical protein ACFVWX_29095 [Streptomyces sp. NPDC058220]|uniref:hypothetical protein n=1 Tax=Streptomyces sp. NPDC058220 TaxID=3346387 RepID=UPI0036E7D507
MSDSAVAAPHPVGQDGQEPVVLLRGYGLWATTPRPCQHCDIDTHIRNAAGQPEHQVCARPSMNQDPR